MAPISFRSVYIQDVWSFQGGNLQRGKNLFHEMQTKASQGNGGLKLRLGHLLINIKQAE